MLLLSSSGNEKLDGEHLERSQKWKLKPSSGGRQGVSIGTEYTISPVLNDMAKYKNARNKENQNKETLNLLRLKPQDAAEDR
jgi:hypothetical protein